jgi:hypothetical protein
MKKFIYGILIIITLFQISDSLNYCICFKETTDSKCYDTECYNSNIENPTINIYVNNDNMFIDIIEKNHNEYLYSYSYSYTLFYAYFIIIMIILLVFASSI